MLGHITAEAEITTARIYPTRVSSITWGVLRLRTSLYRGVRNEVRPKTHVWEVPFLLLFCAPCARKAFSMRADVRTQKALPIVCISYMVPRMNRVGTILNHPRNHRKALRIVCTFLMPVHLHRVGTILNHPRNHLKSLQIVCILFISAHLNHVGTILNHPRNHLKFKEASHKTRILS